jgi:hypothetical protein
MTHQYGNSGNDVVIYRVGNIPEHGTPLQILPGSLTDLNAWVGFRTSTPQQGVKYQL